MTMELHILVYAALLALAQLILFAIPGAAQLGLGYTVGPRDDARDVTGIAGRLQRAYRNHLETLPLFAIAVVVLVIAGKTTPMTALAAQVYLAARILYIPAYVSGLPWLRSVIWAVAMLAIVVLLGCALI